MAAMPKSVSFIACSSSILPNASVIGLPVSVAQASTRGLLAFWNGRLLKPNIEGSVIRRLRSRWVGRIRVRVQEERRNCAHITKLISNACQTAKSKRKDAGAMLICFSAAVGM
jgi:hypothetical protein